MDPITRKLITAEGKAPVHTETLFDTYLWMGEYQAGIHTSSTSVDLTGGGMVWMKNRWESKNWYIADSVVSPLDGSQGDPSAGEATWVGHPSDAASETAWTVPAGVTSICILCVGGGAGADGGNSGGGGGLTWINDVPVTPGTQLAVRQGKTGGRNGSGNPGGSDTHGENSYVNDASGNFIIIAKGGRKNESSSGGSGGNDVNNIGAAYQSLTYGGGVGGHGNNGSTGKGGGGGAGGYSADGGNGGGQCNNGQDGQGGGGGGGGGNCTQDGGQGGGVGIFGEGTSGTGGGQGNYASPGSGGSGGGTGANAYGSWTEETGKFGGGCGAGSGGAGRGAVRIIWGTGRAFPSTNVTQSQVFSHAAWLTTNGPDALRSNQLYGVKEWKDTGFSWEGIDSAENNIGRDNNCNLAYLFKKQKKFFTMVEYTGNSATQAIPHDLECEPSMIWIKNLESSAQNWTVYHKDIDATNPEDYTLILDMSSDRQTTDYLANTRPTATHFSVGSNGRVNGNGVKYISYLFAGDRADFNGKGDVISTTGYYSGNGTDDHKITLGWEPQLVLIKAVSGTNGNTNWAIYDKMRKMAIRCHNTNSGGTDAFLQPNMVNSEDDSNDMIDFQIDGFSLSSGSNYTNHQTTNYIYYAIRNSIPKPQSATEVFAVTRGRGARPSYISNFAVDFAYRKTITSNSSDWNVGFRKTSKTDMKWNDKNTVEGSYTNFQYSYSNGWEYSNEGSDNVAYMFKRAEGFFDCQFWTGNDVSGRQIPHQLGALPEMIITKPRDSSTEGWFVYHKDLPTTSYLKFDDEGISQADDAWTATPPNDTHFIVGSHESVNGASIDYVGQLYASFPGISKVGSYTATGNAQEIDCGFTAGPRYLLIKRYLDENGTGATGGANWNLFDTVRGMAEPHATLGEFMDDVPGQKTWTVPAGVTSISVVCIGGGGGCVIYPQGTTGASGGGGAALAYKNNISVTPGQTITYNVGDGGKGATTVQQSSAPDDTISGSYAESGTPSWFNGTNVNDAVVMGYQGGGAQSYTGGTGGEFSNSTGDGGGSGGTGGSNDGNHAYWAFGGGAGGYSGDGGNGGRWQAGGSTVNTGDGQGGAAGGGNSWANQCGTGAFGEGTSGLKGQGGSGGYPQSQNGSGYYPNGGKYGGGGSSHGSNSGSPTNRGAQGVVRVVWSTDGTTREFPTTNVQNTDQGHDALLTLNTQSASVSDTNYLLKTNSGFILNANTILSTAGAKYIFLAIA